MNFKRIASLVLLISISLAPIPIFNRIHCNLINNGRKGYSVTNPAVKVGNLQDNSYTYTGADIVVYELGIHIDNYVTVVVIDDGLRGVDWKALEQNPEANVNIIGFLTKTAAGLVKWIVDPDDQYLEAQEHWSHGFATTSVVGTIARNVRVIFVDMQMIDFFGSDPYGFYEGDIELWEWLDNYQSTFDIDIITWSQVTSTDFVDDTPQIADKWNNMIDNGVIMIAGAGNGASYIGNYRNKNGNGVPIMYPQYYTEWYTIGSIDHETRTSGSPISTKHQRSIFSSWYESTTSNNHIVNWLDPGNGIPALTYARYDPVHQRFIGTWRYHCGTSFSTPYLAAIVALIITGYHNGIGSSTDPTVQKVIEILQYASSRSTFDQKMGFGYVDAYMAYGKAYTEGRLA